MTGKTIQAISRVGGRLSGVSCGTSGTHLNLDVANFSCGPNDGSAHQGREDVLWKVGACIATLHKLHMKTERETGKKGKKWESQHIHNNQAVCGESNVKSNITNKVKKMFLY